MLLITTLIISLLVWRSDLFTPRQGGNAPAVGQSVTGATGLTPIIAPVSIQGQIQAVEKAKDVVKKYEQRNQQATLPP